MTGAWWIVLPVNAFVAVYGGAWLGKVLVGQPYIGAALALINLLASVVMVAKERPSLRERVQAAARMRSPYSSLLTLLVTFSLAECVVFLAVSSALRWLQGGL